MAPSAEVDQFADDLTVCTEDMTVEGAAKKMQPALNAIEIWAKENKNEIAADKTEVLVISLDPRETAGKAVPELMMDNTRIRSEKQATILGVSIDSQLTFTSHCQNMAKKISKRTQVLSALAGKNWEIVANDLRSVYCSYVRPGGLYSSEIGGPFLARTNINRLEVVNNRAAAIITGTPRG